MHKAGSLNMGYFSCNKRNDNSNNILIIMRFSKIMTSYMELHTLMGYLSAPHFQGFPMTKYKLSQLGPDQRLINSCISLDVLQTRRRLMYCLLFE